MGKRSVEEFVVRVERELDYFRQEWEISYAEVIGALEIVKQRMISELMELEEEE